MDAEVGNTDHGRAETEVEQALGDGGNEGDDSFWRSV
jgi:hypothetical protein